MYAKVDAQVLARLEEIVGEGNLITDRDRMEPYSHDETPALAAWPEVVVKVGSTEEVAAILKLANKLRIPVTPRAGGQGLSGGSVPTSGGIVLSVERMNRILEIDHDNLMVTVEPGVITQDLHLAVEAEGLFYPPDPANMDACCLGGNIAEGAGGQAGGQVRHYQGLCLRARGGAAERRDRPVGRQASQERGRI